MTLRALRDDAAPNRGLNLGITTSRETGERFVIVTYASPTDRSTTMTAPQARELASALLRLADMVEEESRQ